MRTDQLSHHLRSQTRLGRRLAARTAELRRRHVPLHWTNLFGIVSLASVVVLLITGVILMFFYTPSGELVSYHGGYLPLQGAKASKAFESTMAISREIPSGLLLRQTHHWAGLLLPASLVMQLLVMFFTGGFRRPRQASWVLLFLLFLVAIVGGWSGYALPDDMLSGSGLRIVQGVALGIPIFGTWLSTLLFGGEFPGSIIETLYPIHVVIVPILLIVLLVARIRSSYRHKPPQFAGPGRAENNVVGLRVWPSVSARAGGLFAIVTGALFLIGATVTISPIWVYGPSSPGDASAGSQPDWYTGFLDGALRLVPTGWEVEWLDHTWSLAILVPLAVIGVFFGIVMLFPYIEAWITGDRGDHHILERPRNAPTRTGIGVAGIIFYGVLWGSASADILATHFHVGVEGVITVFQVTLLLGPVLGFSVTRRVCFALQRKDREVVVHGYETGRIVRLPGGEYFEVQQPVDRYERWRLARQPRPEPAPVRLDVAGRIRPVERLRAALSRWFFEDRIAPLDPQLGRSPDRPRQDNRKNTVSV